RPSRPPFPPRRSSVLASLVNGGIDGLVTQQAQLRAVLQFTPAEACRLRDVRGQQAAPVLRKVLEILLVGHLLVVHRQDPVRRQPDRKSTRLNSSHVKI